MATPTICPVVCMWFSLLTPLIAYPVKIELWLTGIAINAGARTCRKALQAPNPTSG